MNFRKYIWVGVLLLTFVGCKIRPKRSSEIINVNHRLSSLIFINKYIDFGKVRQDTLLIGKYRFYNSGSDTLFIKYVNPDCSCTGYSLSNDTIQPLDTAFIELKFDTKEKLGFNKIYTTVRANTQTEFYKLTLKAYVEEE
ncbi:DUF1573 domain-containing protein [Labilibaculum sp. DW002]|uniref:DUF1573 domain-containing protein n=1 Tax=Paralabilibaculum antarcticum TaxID=2912572 RepID=A0ABT5VR79_9BACT|nr:DUF1573 domain-containing protein [Labilibaculum sp. DW002]MDE5417934.1 DUF1573 domain-containing protein [Labilibaculum sp. DW002]